MNSLLDKDDDHIDIDENKDYEAELVGDGKKFKTTKDMAKGKYLADRQVEVLTRRMDEMREDYLKAQDELKTRASIESMLDQIATRDHSTNRDDTTMRNEDKKPVLDPDQLDSLIDTRISSYEKTRIQQANRAAVEAKLKERYGNNYKSVLSKQVEELGMSAEDVDSMANRSPKAFFKTFGLDKTETETFEAPLRNNQRSSFTPDTGEKRTWSYYKKIRKSDPTQYYTAKIHNQMLKDMDILGKDFEDGDYNLYNTR